MQTKGTPVIYRKFREGDVIALFPTHPGDAASWTCSSYMQLGQHGAADRGLIWSTKPAKPEEYAALQTELVAIGYNDLILYRRWQSWFDEARQQNRKPS